MIQSLYTFCFKSDSKYYLYNSRSNYFVEISGELFDAFMNEDWDSLPEVVLNHLKDKEVIVDKKDKYDYYYSQLLKFNTVNFDPLSLSLIIAPTTGCNFDCPYCFEPKLSPKKMTADIINSVIDFVKSHKDAKKLHLTWYGGEPLLAFDSIKALYKRLTEEGMPEIVYHGIITNGYFFEGEVIEFFKENKLDKIQITLDGVKGRHDKTRALKSHKGPTFDRIIENIDKIYHSLPDTRIDIRVNIDKTNYKEFVELYRYFRDKYKDDSRVAPYPGLIREETEDGRSLCATSITTKEVSEFYRLLSEEGMDVSLFPKRNFKGCMMQAQGAYIIGPEGEIYKCWNDVSNPDAVVGNIKETDLTNPSRFIKYAMQSSPYNDECKECMVFPLCDGGCSYHRYRNNFEGCNFELCSPFKDMETLKYALLTKEIKVNV